MPCNARSRIKAADASVKPLLAAKHGLLAADDMRLGLAVWCELRCQVAAADVFGEGGADIAFNFSLEIHAGAVGDGRAALYVRMAVR
jgi:hypothetical protein